MTDFFLLDSATGSIQAGPDQQDRLDEVTTQLGDGDFYVPAPYEIASACIDGRPGGTRLVPNAAGGTESLLVADDLTRRRYAATTTAEGYGCLLDDLMARGLPVGGHADDHATGAASGCGANDRLASIYAFIAEHGDTLRTFASALGITVADATHALIVRRARERTAFSDGAELLAVLRSKAGDRRAPVLHGPHREVAAVINAVPATTLDRDALAQAYPGYQAFNVDTWAFGLAADALSPDGTGVPSLIAALAYYNLATAHVLCGPKMRVIVRGGHA